MTYSRKMSWLIDLSLWFVILLAIYSAFLGSYPLGVPDESRYCEIPREMVVNHDYITPRLNGLLYFEKPPLFYWLQTLAIKTLGTSEWAMRFPTAFMAVLGCLMTYVVTRKLYDRATASLATLILSSSLLYFAMGHLITIDMTLSVLLTACLYSALLATRLEKGYQQGVAILTAFAFAGLTTLTKGLIGLLFPGVITFSWIIFTKRWQILKSLYIPLGFVILLAILLPWHIYLQHLHPDFFHFYILEQQFLRYLTLSAARYQPAWFFIPILLLGLFPWTSFLPQTLLYHWQKRTPEIVYLLLWIAWIFLFFSFSKSKLIPYVLPIFPPLAILLASYLNNQVRLPPSPGLAWGYYFLPLLAGGICYVLVQIPFLHTVNHPQAALQGLKLLSAVLLVGTLLAILTFKRHYFALSHLCLGFFTLAAWVIMITTIKNIDNRSIKPLAITLKPLIKSNDIVASYDTYYQDLPFYIQRRVVIVDWRNELDFGMHHNITPGWVYDNPGFWQLWQGNRKIYMITSREMYTRLHLYHSNLFLVARTSEDVLLTNQR